MNKKPHLLHTPAWDLSHSWDEKASIHKLPGSWVTLAQGRSLGQYNEVHKNLSNMHFSSQYTEMSLLSPTKYSLQIPKVSLKKENGEKLQASSTSHPQLKLLGWGKEEMAIVGESKAEHCPFSSTMWLLTRINTDFSHLNLNTRGIICTSHRF